MGPLLRDLVALLAMKRGRAPLPVSSSLWKGLLRKGLLNDAGEVGKIARRISFLGDERLLLAELRVRGVTASSPGEITSKETEIAVEDRPRLEDTHKCQ
jgi:hypothetical protein